MDVTAMPFYIHVIDLPVLSFNPPQRLHRVHNEILQFMQILGRNFRAGAMPPAG
jgi:hypothetical protein